MINMDVIDLFQNIKFDFWYYRKRYLFFFSFYIIFFYAWQFFSTCGTNWPPFTYKHYFLWILHYEKKSFKDLLGLLEKKTYAEMNSVYFISEKSGLENRGILCILQGKDIRNNIEKKLLLYQEKVGHQKQMIFNSLSWKVVSKTCV